MNTILHDFSWDRMIAAVEEVRERARRAAGALRQAGIPHVMVGGHAVPTLDALVRMKLTSFRLKDRLHLMDLLDVGLIDATWRNRVPPPLADRLRDLIEERERDR